MFIFQKPRCLLFMNESNKDIQQPLQEKYAKINIQNEQKPKLRSATN